jgi:hypothetical protein
LWERIKVRGRNKKSHHLALASKSRLLDIKSAIIYPTEHPIKYI